MKMMLESLEVKVMSMKPKLKAFVDNINVLAKGNGEKKSLLKRLDELITWTRMIQGKKNIRNCRIVKEKLKDLNFSMAGFRIPTVKKKHCEKS